ncbi:hypothetical protein HMN09_00866200 [Mycena chlorophos]|uniref:Uncharacterized protein n=1 Tax=Mycena chlorophos TaxID=658473 RepID=A0A8H6W4A0_MYCCL|nr:hypothetical protein HMN09_00866200 [Mycena chlorophos]
MPILTRPNDEHISVIILAASVKFIVNVQHDCRAAACEASGMRPVMQERVESQKTERYIVHGELERFILNTHSFHNAHLLRATLDRVLWAPAPLFLDRRLKHDELAKQLRRKKVISADTVELASADTPDPDAASEQSSETRGGGPPARKRANSAASHEEAPPRKRGRKRKAPVDPPVVLPAVSAAITGNTSLAAGRTKRTIRKTARAQQSALQEAEWDSEGPEVEPPLSEDDSERDNHEGGGYNSEELSGTMSNHTAILLRA